MTVRLSVLIEAEELREIRQAAQRRRITVSAWVRETLRRALRNAREASVQRKLKVIEEAATHSFPTADVDQMLAEIGRGSSASTD